MPADIATAASARRVNAAHVLRKLRVRTPAEAEMSSGDLMDATGMSRPTVLAAAEHLVRLGWVRENSAGRSAGRGRPARVFSFAATAGYVLGIDIGAHSVRVALADLHGASVGQGRHEFGDPGISPGQRIAQVRTLAAETVRGAGLRNDQVLAVCVGTSGTVDVNGVVRLRTGIPGFVGVDLRAALAQDFSSYVCVENDCNLALIGERWRGCARSSKDVVSLLAGERLGVGMCADGTLVRGHENGARDLGFLSLQGGYSDEDAIAARVRDLGALLVARLAAHGSPPRSGIPGAELYELTGGDPRRVTASGVFEASRRGDAGMAVVLDEGLEAAALAIATLSMLLAPELVVITGAVAAGGDVLLPPLRRRVAGLMPLVPRIEASPLRENAVVTGAVRLALDAAEAHFLDELAPAPPA
ncbi:ROK family protein [Streptomyces sp. WMMC500]|uniref:ROK family transcriptional regulator n=1 Tax=Streptomyces sp. WMMC500 TaxID=3015154 RepID=UPI00248D305E|nr:ROK family protein [Streptomyces sp. WMMC500]WBB62028.1 ROK family protein [Streptomyces sp. WMMC500]